MRELCLKLDDKEVERIMGIVDSFLRRNKKHIPELFDNKEKFAIHAALKGQEDIAVYEADELDFYFHDYTLDEFNAWVKEHMHIFLKKDTGIEKEAVAKTAPVGSPAKSLAKSPVGSPAKSLAKSPEIKLVEDYAEAVGKFLFDAVMKKLKMKGKETVDLEFDFSYAKDGALLKEEPFPELQLKYTSNYPSIQLYVMAYDNIVSIDHAVYKGQKATKMNLYEAAAEDIDYDAYADDNEFHMEVRKYRTEDYIKLKWSYVLKHPDVLEGVLHDVAKAMVVPAKAHAHLAGHHVGYTLYALQSARDDGKNILALPSRPNLDVAVGKKKGEFQPAGIRTPTSPSDTPMKYKKGLTAFMDADGKRVRARDLPVDGSKVYYMGTKWTPEMIRTAGKADAYGEVGVSHVFDSLFFRTVSNSFVMVGMNGTHIVSFEFDIDATLFNPNRSHVETPQYRLENTYELMDTNKKASEVTPKDYAGALGKKYDDIVLLYTKGKKESPKASPTKASPVKASPSKAKPWSPRGTNTPSKYKTGMGNFRDASGKRLSVKELPLVGNVAYTYKDTKKTPEDIRKAIKASLMREGLASEVFDVMFYSTGKDTFVMAGTKSGLDRETLFGYEATVVLEGTMLSARCNRVPLMQIDPSAKIEPKDYVGELFKRHDDIVLLYGKGDGANKPTQAQLNAMVFFKHASGARVSFDELPVYAAHASYKGVGTLYQIYVAIEENIGKLDVDDLFRDLFYLPSEDRFLCVGARKGGAYSVDLVSFEVEATRGDDAGVHVKTSNYAIFKKGAAGVVSALGYRKVENYITDLKKQYGDVMHMGRVPYS